MSNIPEEGAISEEGGTYVCRLETVVQGSPTVAWTGTLQTVSYENSAFTAEEVNDPSFGVALALKGAPGTLAYVDSVRARVRYVRDLARVGFTPSGVLGPGSNLPVGTALFSVTRSNSGRRVIVGDLGRVKYSDNGSSWIDVATGYPGRFRSVVWVTPGADPLRDGGLAPVPTGFFLAVGENGAIYTSTDATAWVRQTQSEERNYFGVTYNPVVRRFAIVGEAASGYVTERRNG